MRSGVVAPVIRPDAVESQFSAPYSAWSGLSVSCIRSTRTRECSRTRNPPGKGAAMYAASALPIIQLS